jgi:glycosyltransferase involved in cell wall biosynthesis
MVEAQACGRPVVAFARGGACEIVSDGITGILFEKQEVDSLCDAIERFEKIRFDPAAIRASALRFAVKRFRHEFSQFVAGAVKSSFFSKQACAS